MQLAWRLITNTKDGERCTICRKEKSDETERYFWERQRPGSNQNSPEFSKNQFCDNCRQLMSGLENVESDEIETYVSILDDMRDSGGFNMAGAQSYVMDLGCGDIDRLEAKRIAELWRNTVALRKQNSPVEA